MSIETCSIQYGSDELMRKKFGDDYGIACCVSAIKVGKQLQFFGARAKPRESAALRDKRRPGRNHRRSGWPRNFSPAAGSTFDYDDVMQKFDQILDWLAALYVNTLNVIHYMHDKYGYEKLQMALHDDEPIRTMACRIAEAVGGRRLAISNQIRKGQAPKGQRPGLWWILKSKGIFRNSGIMTRMGGRHRGRSGENLYGKTAENPDLPRRHTHPVHLTITSNVVYGKKTGSTPDGRKAGEPFAPGANPMHGRDSHGSIASMMSVAKLPYDYSEDGISYTFSIVREALGRGREEQEENLVRLMDGYFEEAGHHINVNVINRDVLLDAMEHPNSTRSSPSACPATR